MKNFEEVQHFGVNFRTREIYIGPTSVDSGTVDLEIGLRTLVSVAKACHALDRSDGPITVHFCSPGGDVYAGLGIFDILKSMRNHVTIICHGLVASMGAIILQAADTRAMMPNSTLLLHEVSSNIDGPARAVKTESAESKRLMDLLNNIILDRAKPRGLLGRGSYQTRLERLTRAYETEVEVYFDPARAKKWGLIDEILTQGGVV